MVDEPRRSKKITRDFGVGPLKRPPPLPPRPATAHLPKLEDAPIEPEKTDPDINPKTIPPEDTRPYARATGSTTGVQEKVEILFPTTFFELDEILVEPGAQLPCLILMEGMIAQVAVEGDKEAFVAMLGPDQIIGAETLGELHGRPVPSLFRYKAASAGRAFHVTFQALEALTPRQQNFLRTTLAEHASRCADLLRDQAMEAAKLKARLEEVRRDNVKLARGLHDWKRKMTVDDELITNLTTEVKGLRERLKQRESLEERLAQQDVEREQLGDLLMAAEEIFLEWMKSGDRRRANAGLKGMSILHVLRAGWKRT